MASNTKDIATVIAEAEEKLEKERMILEAAKKMHRVQKGEKKASIESMINDSIKRTQFLKNEIKKLKEGRQTENTENSNVSAESNFACFQQIYIPQKESNLGFHKFLLNWILNSK